MWLRDSSLVARRATSTVTGVDLERGARRSAPALESAAARHDHPARPRGRAARRRRAVPLGRRPRRRRRLPAHAARSRCASTRRSPRSSAAARDRRVGRRARCCAGVIADGDLPVIRDGRRARRRARERRRHARRARRRRRPRPTAAPARSTRCGRAAGHDARPRDGPRPRLRRRGRRRGEVDARPPACWPIRAPAGATYLDVRVPERVAAGGLGPVEPSRAPRRPATLRPSTVG